ncbi:hypothetical protein A0H81_07770 [Grifola frondosa]|uniref:Uncharacterized protein n=1 Tax=Grifola frondosa TaxID=5627 RepID=A0A1C7M7L5_GRIFR|nr:hypothetical protein A0H81_07770 [Grifola frondosa]
MLRWCLPTVRVAGGCGRALDVLRTSSSTSRGLPELGTYVIGSNATYESVSLSRSTLRQLRKLHNSSVAGRLPCDLRRGRQWNSAVLQLSSLAQLTPGIETAKVVLDYEIDVGELEVSTLTAADTDQAKDTLNAVVPSTLPPPDDSESSEPPSVDKLRSLFISS